MERNPSRLFRNMSSIQFHTARSKGWSSRLLRLLLVFTLALAWIGSALPPSPARADARTWALTGSLSAVRSEHTATLLATGKVLVAGGNNGSVDLSSAELYTPVTGAWATTGAMNAARKGHTATLLDSGLVLAAGRFI